MYSKELFNFCKELGCCNACCLRYMGVKNYNIYKNIKDFVKQFQEKQSTEDVSIDLEHNTDSQQTTVMKSTTEPTASSQNESALSHEKDASANNSEQIEMDSASQQCDKEANIESSDTTNNCHSQSTRQAEIVDSESDGSPPKKKSKIEICVSCLGVLQEDSWPKSIAAVKEVLDKKKYECATFACALSAPLTTLLREKCVSTALGDKFPNFSTTSVTPLKEAWKSTFGEELDKHLNMSLDSGAVAPLLITVTIDYPNEMQELDLLKQLSPRTFSERGKQKRRFKTEFTKVSVEAALADIKEKIPLSPVSSRAECVSVVCTHSPVYLGGRYIKLSRCLPQTPWVVAGKRMMSTSVQEIIFGPLAKLYGLSLEETESQMKFMSAGREDVDVRCLGDGRPFAIEVSDPRRSPTEEELTGACKDISDKRVIITRLVPVTREALSELKKGEETKRKNYQALCIKLQEVDTDQGSAIRPAQVTDEDIAKMCAFSNMDVNGDGHIPIGNGGNNHSEGNTDKLLAQEDSIMEESEEKDDVSLKDEGINSSAERPCLKLNQRTPLRVLHRRTLLTRQREIYKLHAEKVSGAPELFVLHVETSAGTYVKEFVCGELGRSTPALGDAMSARADILALDVTRVRLAWP